MPKIDMLKISELKFNIRKSHSAGHGVIEKLDDNLIDVAKELVSASKEEIRAFFFTPDYNILSDLIVGFAYLSNKYHQSPDKNCEEFIENNIQNLSALLFYLIDEYEKDVFKYLTEKRIEHLLNSITLLAENRANIKLLTFLFEKMCATLSIINVEELSRCLFYSDAETSAFFYQLIKRLDGLKDDKQIFGLLLSLLNLIIFKVGDQQQEILKKYALGANILWKVISILQPITLYPQNTDNTAALIQFISSLSTIRAKLTYSEKEKKMLQEDDQYCAFLLIKIVCTMIINNLNATDIKIISNYINCHLDHCKTQSGFIVNFPISNNSFFIATTSLSNTLKKGNAENISIALQLLTKMTNLFSGNAIFNANNSPSDVNCFTTLFSLTRATEVKYNISFLTYVFDTLLNKLDEADQRTKETTLSIFKESKEDYADALQFYLFKLSPEKLKSILVGGKLITKIIDIKPWFSEKSDLRKSAEELRQHQEAGLYSTKNKFCKALTMEIKRLRDKRNLNDTDIELSNIFIDIKTYLKNDLGLLTADELEITLIIKIGQAKKIQSQKRLDTETVALLSKIEMIKSWYATEYQKEENFLDELLFIASEPSIPTAPEVKKEKADAESQKAAPAAAGAPPVIQQRLATGSNFFSSAYYCASSSKIADIDALSVPTLNPAIAALKVPKDPIRQDDDIIDELFNPIRYKI